MAIEKTVKLNVDATQADKALNKFGGTLEDVYGEGVQPLNFAIGELEDRLYELAAAGDTTSDEFVQMTEEVGRMKKVIIETDLLVDGMSQTMTQNVGGAVMGLASGFELAQGAMGAFGVESQAVEETLLKVQSAMAISQGLQGIKESIASFRALGAVIAKTAIGQKALNIAQAAGAVGMRILNAVMNANPVFLIITGIAALTAAIVLFTRETENAQAAQDKLNSELDAYNNLLEKVKATADKVHDNRMRQLQLEGASETELHEERVRNIKTQEKLRVAELKSIKDINNQRRANLNKALKEGNKDLADSIKTEIQDSKKRYEELARQNKDYHLNLAEENKQFEEQEAQRRKEAWEKYKAARDERLANDLAARREIQDRRLALEAEGLQKSLEQNRIATERELEANEADATKSAEQKAEIQELILRQSFENEKQIRAEFDEGLTLKTKELADERGIIEFEARIRTEKEIQQEIRAIQRENFEQRLTDFNGYLGEVQAGMQSIADLDSAVTELQLQNAEGNEAKQEQIRKKSFERNKKIQIVMATISGIQGVVNALTAQSTIPEPYGTILKVANAAIVGATTAVNIAKIKNQSYQGGGGSGGGASVGRAPAVPSPANFNVVGNTGNNQLAETLGNAQDTPVKAYVVSGDVTTAQSLDRNKVNNATL